MNQKLQSMQDELFDLHNNGDQTEFRAAFVNYRDSLISCIDDDMNWLDDTELARSIFEFSVAFQEEDSSVAFAEDGVSLRKVLNEKGIFARDDINLYPVPDIESDYDVSFLFSVDTCSSTWTDEDWNDQQLWGEIQLCAERLRNFQKDLIIDVFLKNWENDNQHYSLSDSKKPVLEPWFLKSLHVGEWELIGPYNNGTQQLDSFQQGINILKQKTIEYANKNNQSHTIPQLNFYDTIYSTNQYQG